VWFTGLKCVCSRSETVTYRVRDLDPGPGCLLCWIICGSLDPIRSPWQNHEVRGRVLQELSRPAGTPAPAPDPEVSGSHAGELGVIVAPRGDVGVQRVAYVYYALEVRSYPNFRRYECPI